MDLSTFAEKFNVHAAVSSPSTVAPKLWEATHVITKSEARTDPTVAAMLSQILMFSDEFESALTRRQLDPRAASGRDVMLIDRGNGDYALMIADDHFHASFAPDIEELRIDRPSFVRSFRRWQKHSIAQRMKARRGEFAELSLHLARVKAIDFDPAALASAHVAFIRRPATRATNAPDPAWETSASNVNGRATAGCIVRNAAGREGVTSARHLFSNGQTRGQKARVNGDDGIVDNDNVITDSVFIAMTRRSVPAHARGQKGYLSGVAPRFGAPATFCGVTSGCMTTAVQGMDPGVTVVSAIRQSKVYTPAVTNPGDSGAALVEDATDQIIGFAHERTKAGESIEWSSWIWADSVFTALNLSPC